ncbi:MAG: penicillin-binding protein activator [Rhodospirillaceae bacterium]
MAKSFEKIGTAANRRLFGLALSLLLVACTLTGSPPPATTAAPNLPARTDLPQAPPAVPSKPVTQVPLGPPGGVPAAASGPVKIGLLLPLSGQGANVGSEMLNAAQLALFDLGEDKFVLLPRDTKGSPVEAAQGARALAAEGVRLILGPLYSAEVGEVKPVARAGGIRMLAFSNDWQRAGDGTYIIGLVPADQVSRVVDYARVRGAQRLAVLAPRNPYGEAVAAALRDVATRRGLTLAREERYGNDNADMAAAVARLAGDGRSGMEARMRELAARTDEASRAALARLQAQAAQDTTGGGFDALLIAEGGDKLRALLPMLAANRIDSSKVRLLGTGLWDDPSLASLPGLNGAWFAAPAPGARADFEARFEALYHHKPQRLATVAYDATSLAAVLARSPATATYDEASLTNPSGFSGVDGIFRLRTDGLVERGLAVIEIAPGGARVIDDAPASFEALTN